MNDTLEFVEEEILNSSAAHRVWILPILRSLVDMGRPAPPREIKVGFAESLTDHLDESQIAYLLEKRFGWVGYLMKQLGLITSENGAWSPTELGAAFLERHAGDAPEIPTDTPKLSDAESHRKQAPTETVKVMHYAGYDVPLLEALSAGANKKHEIIERLKKDLKDQLLPGDFRTMPNGRIVWQYRASWALTTLKKSGEARNPGWALWEITDSGRQRLQQERDSWRIETYQTSNASVIVLPNGPEPPPVDPKPPWVITSWTSLGKEVPTHLFEILDTRLRPDLGPQPSSAEKIARNLIFYGPPGTGKTFLALAAAKALTGEEETGTDNRTRIVQFHPSYSYEDFIQGLRPDLEHTELRYHLGRGPFLQICEDASQDPDRYYVLVIDEINRGDPARIFGELLYAVEYRDQPIDLALGGQLIVPANLVLLGTMNSVDRSVALVDYALRRRFGFARVDPDPGIIVNLRESSTLAQAAAGLLSSFNDWLRSRLDADHTLGHSFFLNPAIELESEADLKRIWTLDVRPLLEEYFFGDAESLTEAGKKWASICQQELSELGAADEKSSPADV